MTIYLSGKKDVELKKLDEQVSNEKVRGLIKDLVNAMPGNSVSASGSYWDAASTCDGNGSLSLSVSTWFEPVVVQPAQNAEPEFKAGTAA